MKKTEPAFNSRGKAYAAGDVWTCNLCGETGADRDDMAVSDCPSKVRPGRAPHLNTYTTGGEAWTPGWVKQALFARGSGK